MTHQSSETSVVIDATREALYQAFLDPDALVMWQAPGEMTATVHDFDARVGGGYVMSLYYPAADGDLGKSGGNEDRFATRFVELDPPDRIVQVVTFESPDPAFAGDMTMTITFKSESDDADAAGPTVVTIRYDDVPVGIRPEDNEAGTRDSLRKLAEYVTQTKQQSE